MFDVTRFAYIAILAVMAGAVLAVCTVMSGTGGDNSELPVLTTKQIIDYARFGMVEKIDVEGRDVTVTFADSLDTEDAFGESSHRFRATLDNGETMTGLVEAAGLTAGPGGIEINGE